MRLPVLAALSALGWTVSPCFAHGGSEHQPRHGGLAVSGRSFDLEVVLLKAKGSYQVYFTDTAGEDLPASVASDVTLAVKRSSGAPERLALHIDEGGETWVGSGSASATPIAGARISYRVRGMTEQAEIPFASVFHAEFQAIPPTPRAGQTVQLTFAIKDFLGKTVPGLEIVHEKPMHLMVVSSDLSEFAHIHPEPGAGRVLRAPHVFAHGGNYRLYADFTPVGGANRIQSFSVDVRGPAKASSTLQPQGVWKSSAEGITMTLTSQKSLRTGDDIGLTIALFDTATGAPIHNLQRYLGAWAHIAIISQDLQDFVHVHPTEEPASPSVIRTVTGFRRPGIYKMWVQVQRQNKVTAVPFVFRVVGGGAASPARPSSEPSSGAVLIRVSAGGFQPSEIKAKAGQPLKLAFYRADAQNCGRVVKFPSLGIQRELPPGQTVTIEVTPRKTGPLSFSCGMDMLHGALLVE